MSLSPDSYPVCWNISVSDIVGPYLLLVFILHLLCPLAWLSQFNHIYTVLDLCATYPTQTVCGTTVEPSLLMLLLVSHHHHFTLTFFQPLLSSLNYTPVCRTVYRCLSLVIWLLAIISCYQFVRLSVISVGPVYITRQGKCWMNRCNA